MAHSPSYRPSSRARYIDELYALPPVRNDFEHRAEADLANSRSQDQLRRKFRPGLRVLDIGGSPTQWFDDRSVEIEG